jgi:CHRD domain-containing protein
MMLKLLKLFVVLAAAAALALLVTPTASADPRTTLVAQLSPECDAAVQSGAFGFAVVDINEASGRITYRVVAFNLPGTIAGSPGVHIHGPVTEPGGNAGIALGLELTGLNSGVVASGTTVDPALADAILTNPDAFYVNVHTTADGCRTGAIRGTLEPAASEPPA